MRLTLYIVVIVALFTWLSCHSNPTGPNQHEIAIMAEWVGVTDAALRLHIIYTLSSDKFQLREDTAVIATGRIPLTDTVVYIDNLLPYRSYYFYLAKLDSAGAIEGGSTLTLMTMDTTSNNFTWQFDTLAGQGGSSYLSDVVILDDTTAYAVGALYMLDSAGNYDPDPYNFIVWNGKTWNPQKVGSVFNGRLLTGPSGCVFAFSRNDIWVDGVSHWDGATWQATNSGFGVALYRLWGTSSSNLYGVGENGTIFHYDGSQWTQLQSGTTLDIQDIWGATDSTTGQQTILAVASNDAVSLDRAILKIDGTSVQAIADSGIYQPLNGVWFKPNEQYYVVGSGIYEKQTLADPLWHSYGLTITHYYTPRIRGTDVNDVWASGAYGEIVHFNGARWKSFQSETWLDNGAYAGLAVKGNLVIAVGGLNPVAIIAMGRRQ
jgi:hypothetical protein